MSGTPPRPARLVLLGHPVAHSLSPAFQNAALRHAGIPLTYEALDVAPGALPDVLRGLAHQRAAGNVTVPHKEAVAALCERRTALAERVGAVNTFWVDAEERLTGDNTDVAGVDALARAVLGRAPANLRVALLGAGGSAGAVLAAAERWPGCYVGVWGRTPERAKALVARFPGHAHAAETMAAALDGAKLVINATPVGISGNDVPVPVAQLPKGAAIMDLVYRRGGTPWVLQAKARRLRASDGLPMLIEQGALAFERWLGVAPDREVMWSAVR